MVVENPKDEEIRELLVVENPQAIRLAFSEKPGVILKQITDRELSISEIARALDLNPGSVHYYLKELEKQGLAGQVRQEIKGGVVKKYYRAVARRIVLAGPNFENSGYPRSGSEGEHAERLVRSIEQLGYHVPDEDREEAKELLLRYDRLIKDLVNDLISGGQDREHVSGPAMDISYQFMVHVRALEDPELGRIYNQFRRLFRKDQG